MPTVTALRDDRRGRVAVELDGAPWRVLPLEAVVRAGIAEGRLLDRNALRLLRRELRRAEALRVATRAFLPVGRENSRCGAASASANPVFPAEAHGAAGETRTRRTSRSG